MSYASLTFPLQLPSCLTVLPTRPHRTRAASAAHIGQAAKLGVQSIALAAALWACLALPGFLTDACSVTAYHARISAPR
jgi:hypothetical protein